MRAFLDTNVVLYAAGIDPSAPPTVIARDLLDSGEKFVLSSQVFNEFIAQATGSSRKIVLPFEDAVMFVQTLRRFEVVTLDLAVFDTAVRVQLNTGYSWWDCQIVGAAINAGCDTLLTEDMQHGRIIEGVRIVNPFREIA